MKAMTNLERVTVGQDGTYIRGTRRTIVYSLKKHGISVGRIEVWRRQPQRGDEVSRDSSVLVNRPHSKWSYNDYFENLIPQLTIGLGF